MALASYEPAKSVTGLSESPFFHHQYSSVTDAISEPAGNERDLKRVRRLLAEHQLKYFPKRRVNHFQSDVVNVFREYGPCLRDRQYRHKANNVIRANKPIGIGYALAEVNIAELESGWSVPFNVRRVRSGEDEIEVGAAQIKAICERAEFAGCLNINACDSSYGVAKYIGPVSEIENLVSVIRLRHGNKIYETEPKATRGAPQIYGGKYYLIEATDTKSYTGKGGDYQVARRSLFEKEASEKARIERRTKKGRELAIELRRWKGLKMRTKKGHSMKEVEFDVVGIRVLEKASAKRIFKRDVFVAVVGTKREQLKLEEIVDEFYHRFDLEVTNRLMKQNLYLEGYQTPVVEHFDNWTVLVQEAMWLLWTASGEVEEVCSKWQKYSERKKEKGDRPTAAQTRKGLAKLLLTFEKEDFLPKKCKKGRGREKGEKQRPRQRYEVVRKWHREIEISGRSNQKE